MKLSHYSDTFLRRKHTTMFFFFTLCIFEEFLFICFFYLSQSVSQTFLRGLTDVLLSS